MEDVKEIIGREFEMHILRECMNSGRPEFVAVYGRRRIGKTFLIKQFYRNKFDFYLTGVYDSNLSESLLIFNTQLKKYSGKDWPMPKNWLQAFGQLETYLDSLKKQEIVVFIDELPWLDTPRSRFIRALEYFWNSWGDSKTNLKFIVCGSATTWMTDKLLGDKGGLHNRVTRRIRLAPFNLHDTEKLLRSNGIKWNRHQIVECYMTVGGTPFYLAKMDKAQSLPQNVDRLFFHEEGELRDEFEFLFRSLFKDSKMYSRIVELLADKACGLTREEIIANLKITDGGKLSEMLKNLISCDFIREYRSYGKKERNRLYQLTDLFTLFYLKQVSNHRHEGEGYWLSGVNTAAHNTWSGYAFEQVCLHHVKQIKAALGIAAVATEISSWTGMEEGKKTGQIDLVIDRRDDTINLCEMKYSREEYEITPAYMKKMLFRMGNFRTSTKTRKSLHLTMVTVNGVKHNAQWYDIQNEVSADQLFEP